MRNRPGRKKNVKGRLDIHFLSYLIDEWITNSRWEIIFDIPNRELSLTK